MELALEGIEFDDIVYDQVISYAYSHCSKCDKLITRTEGYVSPIIFERKVYKRYEDRSPVYLSSFENGIWLCNQCGNIINKENSYYTIDMLNVIKLQTHIKHKKESQGLLKDELV